MRNLFKDNELLIRRITLFTLGFIICIGFCQVVFEIKPFWLDEWFIIDNLKTKSVGELWGKLHFLQQFPRTYLALFKSFTSVFNYSYTSLRVLSFIVSVAAILLGYRVMNMIYGRQDTNRYLFILVLVSSFTFTEYFVEVKQYPMDILLSILALWQLLKLRDLGRTDRFDVVEYLLLCTGFLIAPFFSYTYPLAICPVYIIIFMQTVVTLKGAGKNRWKIVLRQYLPLFLGLLSIVIFYRVDARQLASDTIMQNRWSFLMVSEDHKLKKILASCYMLFAQTGSGAIFENVFGILGVCAFIAGIVVCIKGFGKQGDNHGLQVRLYSILVILIAIVLFLLGKLPLGTPRLNAFTTPSITILIIYLLGSISSHARGSIQKNFLHVLLYAATIGNVFVWFTIFFTNPVYKKQMAIYNATQKAIKQAQDANIPIFISPGIAYPYEQGAADAGDPYPAIWILKTFPAYNVNLRIPVYPVKDPATVTQRQQPGNDTAGAIAGDGISYHFIKSGRPEK